MTCEQGASFMSMEDENGRRFALTKEEKEK